MKLIVATQDYAHTRTLADSGSLGTESDALEIDWCCDRPESIFSRALAEDAPFDVAEMSLATTWALADSRDPRFVALPVFTSRMYRLSGFYTCRDGLQPADLAGGKIGVVRYGQTAIVWGRALLQERFNVAPSGIQWWVAERQSFEPKDVDLNKAANVAALEFMLEEGELDCLFATSVPDIYRRGRARRLFPNWAKDEQALYEETGVLPIMHTLLMKRSLAGARPGLAFDVVRRFERAKQRAAEWLSDTDASSIPMPLQHGWAETMTRGGRVDPWPYGVEPNRAALELFASHMAEQGLTSRYISPDDVFFRED